MTIALGVILFFFGTIIGSFLNVVIYRFHSGKTLNGRSMCFSCGKTLHWHELVPLASFLVQKGKCRGCSSQISVQYPLVEAVTGIMFVFLATKLWPVLFVSQGLYLSAVVWYTYFWCLLLVISVYDIRHTIIPDALVWLANFLAFSALFFFVDFHFVPHIPSIEAIAAGPLLALPFWAIWYGSKGKWMGLGDAKLMLGIGWLLGISAGLASMLLAFWIGAIVSVLLLSLKKHRYTIKSEVPFGPFLALGAFIVFITGINFLSLSMMFW